MNRMSRALSKSVAVAAGAVAVPCPAAQAAVVTLRDTTLLITAGILPSDNVNLARTITVTQSGNALKIENPGDFIITLYAEEQSRCPVPSFPLSVVTCDLGGITGVWVATGNGADRITARTSIDTTLCGGAGDDVISAGNGSDLLSGAGGNDVLN